MTMASAGDNVSKFWKLWKKRPNFCTETSPFPRWFWRNLFAFDLIKQNVIWFFFIFLIKNFFSVPLKNLNLNYYCQVLQVSPDSINGGLPGCSSVSPPRLCFFPSLICSPTKQPYSKVDYLRMFSYRNAVFTSNFY